jgi:hypothetical protein
MSVRPFWLRDLDDCECDHRQSAVERLSQRHFEETDCPCRAAIESYRAGETTALTRLHDLETQVSFLLREVAALKGDA